MAKYEKLTVWDDPFDIMCGDCSVHTHETWNEVTEEELQEDWEMEKQAYEYDHIIPTPAENFEDWLAENIEDGWIRKI